MELYPSNDVPTHTEIINTDRIVAAVLEVVAIIVAVTLTATEVEVEVVSIVVVGTIANSQ